MMVLGVKTFRVTFRVQQHKDCVKHSEYSNTKTVLAHIAGQFSQVLKTVTEPASYVDFFSSNRASWDVTHGVVHRSPLSDMV